jgi:hypothetical protein
MAKNTTAETRPPIATKFTPLRQDCLCKIETPLEQTV